MTNVKIQITIRAVKVLSVFLTIILATYFIKSVFLKKGGIRTDKKITAQEETPVSNADKVASFSILGFSETGKKKWEVEGKSADVMADVINLSNINANAFGEETKVNIKADKGIFDRRSNDIELRENVIAVTDEGTKLITQSLKWDAKEERLSTDDRVNIVRDDIEAEGKGASAKPNLKFAQLDRDIKVNVKPATLITCDGALEIDYNNNISYFNENVKLDDGKAQIYADKATAYFDPKRHVVTKVISRGNVKIIRGEDVTYAEELVYLPDEGRILLTGRPKIIIQSPDELMKDMEKKEDAPSQDRGPN